MNTALPTASSSASIRAFRQNASAPSPYLQFQGVKQRLRYELSEPGVWPVDVGLYGEIAEFHDEFECRGEDPDLEALRAPRCGRQPVGRAGILLPARRVEVHLQPDRGALVRVFARVLARRRVLDAGRFDDPEPTTSASGTSDAPTGTRHYAGPTVMLQSGEYFTSLGAYARLDNLGDDAVVGDQFGKVWFRWLIGIHL